MADPGMGHYVDERRFLRIVFDRPGERVNLLTMELLRDLDRVLDSTAGQIAGVLFSSGKSGTFVAGMDVDEISSVTDSHRGAEGARLGQAVFGKIAGLSVPTVCAIGGVCLGGGAELALACAFRVATDSPALKIGLPEVRLGIIPGFGGTQRLPRLVGATAALDLILTGRSLDAVRAKRIGLVDLVVPDAYLERESLKLLERATQEGVERTAKALRKSRGLLDLAFERIGPLRSYALSRARKLAATKASPRDYPAPFRAIAAVEAALTQPLSAGLDIEARIVGELIPGGTSKNLIWLFQSQNALKSDGGSPTAPRKVRRMAVIGAGIMGGGIARLAADCDIPVRLRDLRYDALLSALRTAHDLWRREVERRRMTERELAQRMAYLSPTLDDRGLRHVDLVIEAVVEDLDVKQAVLAALEPRLAERAIFASNTSSLPITDIAARALHPERVVGMHFFNPVHRMPLVEVIAGRRSSPEAVATVHALAVRMGKIPVVVKDGPGFLVNRILTLYINEAMRLVAEGVRIDAVDKAMIAFGMPMGPLALLDEVGLDTARHVGAVLRAALGKRAGGDGNLLDALVSAGKLGTKNGKGIYRYRDGRRTVPDVETYRLAGAPPSRDLPPETLQERMVLAMVNEAAICLDEAVVQNPRDIDVAMVMGSGFPPFRGGLLRHADSVGIPIVTDRLSRLADAQGERFRPADALQRMVREQRCFYR